MNARIDELIALATMGELSDDEQVELEIAAAADPEVAAELAADLATAAALSMLTVESPSPGLRASVLRAIDGIDQAATGDQQVARPQPVQRVEGSHTVDRSAENGSGSWPAPTAPSELYGIDELGAARIRRRDRVGWLPKIAVAAAVALLASASLFVIGRSGSDDTDTVASVIEADDAVRREFFTDLGTSLVVVHSRAEDAIVIEGEEITEPAPNTEYVLWLIDESGATPVGGFLPDDDGTVTTRLDGVDPTDLQMGVTAEPLGGAETPTLPILATA